MSERAFDPVRWGIAMREARDFPAALAEMPEVQRDVALFEVLLNIERGLAEIKAMIRAGKP